MFRHVPDVSSKQQVRNHGTNFKYISGCQETIKYFKASFHKKRKHSVHYSKSSILKLLIQNIIQVFSSREKRQNGHTVKRKIFSTRFLTLSLMCKPKKKNISRFVFFLANYTIPLEIPKMHFSSTRHCLSSMSTLKNLWIRIHQPSDCVARTSLWRIWLWHLVSCLDQGEIWL